jgi:hypothetical protein
MLDIIRRAMSGDSQTIGVGILKLGSGGGIRLKPGAAFAPVAPIQNGDDEIG